MTRKLLTTAHAVRMTALAATALLLTTGSAWAAEPDRDPDFGTLGVVETGPAGFGFDRAGGEDIAIDSEGRILVTFSYAPSDPASGYAGVERLLPDGSLDPDFGADGVVTFNRITNATRVAVDGEDNVLLTGWEPGAGSTVVGRIARFDDEGELDDDFDGNGVLQLGRLRPNWRLRSGSTVRRCWGSCPRTSRPSLAPTHEPRSWRSPPRASSTTPSTMAWRSSTLRLTTPSGHGSTTS